MAKQRRPEQCLNSDKIKAELLGNKRKYYLKLFVITYDICAFVGNCSRSRNIIVARWHCRAVVGSNSGYHLLNKTSTFLNQDWLTLLSGLCIDLLLKLITNHVRFFFTNYLQIGYLSEVATSDHLWNTDLQICIK